MDDRTRASALWGAIGGLAFLVLLQGYTVFGHVPLGLPGRVALAVPVGGLAAGLTYKLDELLARRTGE